LGRNAFKEDVEGAMDKYNVDVIIYPSWTNPPALLSRAYADYKGDNSQVIAPATGLPAATVPMGFSHGNLPAGLQFLARAFQEELLFSAAYAYEQKTKHRKAPKIFSEIQRENIIMKVSK
jgi:Asp-tRNA(Asn)/Glu-tRNA(Gln) amidotransferase A subunit family amidase